LKSWTATGTFRSRMWISKRGKDIRENEAAAQIVCAAAFYLCRTSRWLEVELQRQLQFPRTADGRSNFSKRGGTHERVWSRKMRMIEGVERLRAKLQSHSFTNPRQWEILEQGHGNIPRPRLPNRRKSSRSAAHREVSGKCQYPVVGLAGVPKVAYGRIRIRYGGPLGRTRRARKRTKEFRPLAEGRDITVSYTHLTLPTICSV